MNPRIGDMANRRSRRFAYSSIRQFPLFLVCVLAGCIASAGFAQDEEEDEASNAKPDAGGIVIEPSSGKIAEGDTITITFPVSMVAADLIDVGDQPSPFVSEPKLDGTFLWKSQTEGVFTVSGVVAGARHRLTLAPALKDATGKPLVVKDWSAEYKTPQFAITTDFGERKQLPARPQIYLDSTYAVGLDEAAQHIYFQDRESRTRFPVEVIQTAEEKTAGSLEATGFRVAPREPLPVGRTFDLIVNGLLDAKSRRPLPYLQVIPVGKTQPLEVEWLGAFNHALEEPAIRIKFNDSIDPVEVTPERIRVEPSVDKIKMLASSDQIEITGDYNLKQRYKVTISPDLKGDRGYGLASESRWGATFRPKEACLIFPATQVFARARQEFVPEKEVDAGALAPLNVCHDLADRVGHPVPPLSDTRGARPPTCRPWRDDSGPCRAARISSPSVAIRQRRIPLTASSAATSAGAVSAKRSMSRRGSKRPGSRPSRGAASALHVKRATIRRSTAGDRRGFLGRRRIGRSASETAAPRAMACRIPAP